MESQKKQPDVRLSGDQDHPTTATCSAATAAPKSTPDPEVSDKPKRRRYTARYKLSILEAADACSAPGEIGALLRREGLYSSLLSTWRHQRAEGALGALATRKRGRKPKKVDPLAARVRELESDKRELERQLEQARTVIDVQKKLSQILALEPSAHEQKDESR